MLNKLCVLFVFVLIISEEKGLSCIFQFGFKCEYSLYKSRSELGVLLFTLNVLSLCEMALLVLVTFQFCVYHGTILH